MTPGDQHDPPPNHRTTAAILICLVLWVAGLVLLARTLGTVSTREPTVPPVSPHK